MKKEKCILKDYFRPVVVLLLLVNIAVGIFAIFNVEHELFEMEEMKIGGAENFTLQQQIYNAEEFKKGQNDYLKQIRGNLKGQAEGQEQLEKPTPAPTSPINDLDEKTMETIQSNLKDAYIEGKKDARFTILEYSELLCPYCKREHIGEGIKQTLEKYPDLVNTTFRHFIVHPQAYNFAEAAECAGEQKGQEAFLGFIHEAFVLSPLNKDSIDTIIEKLGLNKEKLTACLTDGKYKDKVTAQTDEGRSLFKVRGTPGNVIIDWEKGKVLPMPGLRKGVDFQNAIELLLANEE